jgi:Rrf2 family iron-sulfur cluster assembly transcriptional regulator
MTALSQSSGYAVLALGFVASAAGKPMLVRTIAETCGLPAPYLSKVIHKLARAGLVSTQRGVRGGVSMRREPDSLTLLEVCEALDDPVLEHRCMLGTEHCSAARACPAHEYAAGCRARLLEFLGTTTIADISAFEAKQRWIAGPATNGRHAPPPRVIDRAAWAARSTSARPADNGA